MLEQYFVSATSRLPEVSLDAQTGRCSITGRSIPEDAVQFYRPVLHWMEHYAQHPGPETHLVFRLEYFNTSSGKYLLEICRCLETAYYNKDAAVLITWQYEDGDATIEEAGEDFRSITKVPFELVSVDGRNRTVQHKPAGLPLRSRDISKQSLPKNFTLPAFNQEPVLDAEQLLAMNQKQQQELAALQERLNRQAAQLKDASRQQQDQQSQLAAAQAAKQEATLARKATSMALTITVFLFILSEVVEQSFYYRTGTPLDIKVVLMIKLGLALLIKPMESLLLRYYNRPVRLPEAQPAPMPVDKLSPTA